MHRHYTAEEKNQIFAHNTLYDAVSISVNKKDAISIFRANEQAKTELEMILSESGFVPYAIEYSYDIAAEISRDYDSLLKEGMSTLILVFIAIFLFVGFFDALFATITLPLAFLSTFIILNQGGYSMNFLTNFSLILSFGIAIDTIIVIVQAAGAKLRLGYDPKTTISLALREYAVPTISGVSTTIVVFVPMMVLPGIMGKFLAYIPITIFGVLASGLILALTVNSALYLLMVRRKKTYSNDVKTLEYAREEERELLALEREGKTLRDADTTPFRRRIIDRVISAYRQLISAILPKKWLRRTLFILPVVFFFFGIFFLAPLIKFELFPSDDNGFIVYTIEGAIGTNTEAMYRAVGDLSGVFQDLPELKNVSINTRGNTTSISVELHDKTERKALGQRDAFALEAIMSDRLQ